MRKHLGGLGRKPQRVQGSALPPAAQAAPPARSGVEKAAEYLLSEPEDTSRYGSSSPKDKLAVISRPAATASRSFSAKV